MSSQQSKRQRTAAQNSATLRRLAHTGNVTIRGLVDLIGTLRDDPEALVSKFRVEEAILEPFRQIRHTETLPLHDGTTFDWEFCDPNLLLAKVVAESPALAALYADAANKHPCSAEDPWSLVIGFDEFTPGNKLAVDNKRKIMNMSFSFLQLGRALHSDGTWMTPVSVRSSMIAQVQGGWSRMLSLYLRLQLASATGLSLLSTCMEHNSWEPD